MKKWIGYILNIVTVLACVVGAWLVICGIILENGSMMYVGLATVGWFAYQIIIWVRGRSQKGGDGNAKETKL